jgi:hypothetical protein
MVKKHPLNFRIPSDEELGLKPLDLPPILDIEKYCEKIQPLKKENDPLNFRIPSEEELGLKPLDLHIDPLPSDEELGLEPLDLHIDPLPPMPEINLDLDFDLRNHKHTSPVVKEQ